MSHSLAAVFHGSSAELEYRRIALPHPADREVLVRVLGCTLCGSDLHTYDGRREVVVPTILGHEIVGEIAELGSDAPRTDATGHELRIGDRVTWSIVANCGRCFFCQRDLPQKCVRSVKYGHEPLRPGGELSGGLAEHCLLAPGTALIRLPDPIPLASACPASCATATIAAALAAAGDARDRHVCILGLGLLGLTAAAMLSVAGAASITAVDIDESRRQRAIDFGATHAVSPADVETTVANATEGYGFDVVLELSGSQAAFESGWRTARTGGTLVLVGAVFPTDPVSLPPEQIVRRNLTIRGIHNYAPNDLAAAVHFLEQHHSDFPFAELVTDWLPLAEAAQAFKLASRPECIRVGVRPE